MVTFLFPRRDHRDWKTLYRAAILEKRRTAISGRVAEAEQAVLARGRELSYAGGTREEQEDLGDALYTLQAYRTAWEHTDAEMTSITSAAAA